MPADAPSAGLSSGPDGTDVARAATVVSSLFDDPVNLSNVEKFRAIFSQISQGVLVKNLESEFLFCNESLARNLGIAAPDIAGKTDFDFFPRALAEHYRADDQRVIHSGERIEIEEPFIAEGRNRWIRTTKAPWRLPSGEIAGVVVVLSDITERKEAEQDLARKSWALKALSDGNKAMIYSDSEQSLVDGVCQAIVADGIYPLAWIGWKEHDAGQTVSIAAAAGPAIGYNEGLQISWGDNSLGHGPSGTAIRTGQIVLENDFDQSAAFHPWIKRAKSFHLGSSVAIPVRIEGNIAGVLTVYASVARTFSQSAIALFEEMASNIGYGIASRRTRNAYEQAITEQVLQAQKLEKALRDALMAISSTLEHRDPYTVGHEKSVADIAVRIGRHLGWDEHRLQGLYFAGIVHDLGKIQIPVEILTKPVKLTAAEYALIKTHPETGYEILKNIDFPWPIAEIVRQHHEYLDGSGYPRGLSGSQILEEARILTVADIFDSMSSARPYRAALGKDVAIDEIRRLSGTRLDSAVVDALLSVV